MRLLQRQCDGSVTLTKDLTGNLPPYAILSHTWGDDDQEVNFDDVTKGVGQHKDGYRKIEFCAKQASADSLQYFWVDSCCINKSSSAELQEAITSMFRWYQNASKCYVYLPDVSNDNKQTNELPRLSWEPDLRKSRWFTRGWTLQELIAPRCVEFFSVEGQKIGNKTSLEQLLHEITGIAINALRGRPLSEFGISERMLWSRGRETKRKEDKAYSLFGIFGVSTYVNYGEGEEHAMNRLRDEIDKCLGFRPDQKTHFMVPFGRNKEFVGRDHILQQLLTRIPPSANKDDCQRMAIEGLGGVGKTQIALEAAYRVRDMDLDCSVFLVPAINAASLENSYREIGQKLQVQGINMDNADVKTLVKLALSEENAGKWLLIIDNADDLELLFGGPQSLSDYLPMSRNGSILLTTRDHRTACKFTTHQADIITTIEMSEAEALAMLQNHLSESQVQSKQDTKRLLQELAYLPLAIKQASAYIATEQLSISEYLNLYQTSDADMIGLLSEHFEDRHRYQEAKRTQNPIATTWLISFNQITKSSPVAASYLKFICFLAEKDIPKSLLPIDSKKEASKAVSTLKAYAFITEHKGSDSFDLHRLVRSAMRNWVEQENEWKGWITKGAQQLSEKFPWPEHENKEIWMRYLPHTQTAVEFQRDCADRRALWRLLLHIGQSYSILGKYKEAELILRPAVELREKVLGREHPDTLVSMNNFAEDLRNQGRYEKAEQIHRQTLELREQVLGREHPNTLASISNLALVLDSRGKHDEAEQMQRQTLELREQVLGREHPDTLASMNNLALVLDSQGKYNEAEQMQRQTLEVKKKVLGREHPDTLASMNILALILSKQGKYDEAKQMYRQTLKLREKVLGRKHPDTLTSVDGIVLILDKQWKYGEAKQMHNVRRSVL
ncbi:hypothetical protein DL771_002590 [Monosporascus sp. 5C6A]|nr:hypothetical protein DL771_002590 [Monosporascus sp. 5C6A]